MPTVRHKPDIRRITRVIDKVITQTDKDLEYITLGLLAACFEFKGTNHLTWRWLKGFLQAIEFIEYRGNISKTTLWDYLGERYDKSNNDLPEQLAGFFFLDPKTRRYTLSPMGQEARQGWATLLRRVLQDDKERYRLLYDHWNKEEVQRRKQLKRFFGLPIEEQIWIARQLFAMPGTTEQERAAKQAARRWLHLNYDVRPRDLYQLAQQYPVIQAYKHMPPGQETTDTDPATIFRRPEQPAQTPENIQPGDNTPQGTAQ